jgi:hypothetical protein
MTGYPNEDEGPDEVNWEEVDMSEEKPEHTPLPWSTGGIFNPKSDNPTVNIWGPIPVGKQSGKIIAHAISVKDANLIIRSVNAVPDLVAALDDLIDILSGAQSGFISGSDTDQTWDIARSNRLNNARAALARVKP